MQRFINIGLLISPLIAYLEWGGGKMSAFLGQMEYTLFFQSQDLVHTFTHPIVVIPILGQLLLLYTIFQAKPSRKLTLIGIILQSVLLSLVLIAGLLSFNFKMILSVIPFILIIILHFFSRS